MVRLERKLSVDLASREVHLDGNPVGLTRIEFDLLACLLAAPRIVVTTQALLQEVWGDGWWGEDHHVEVHISRLRRKLGESGNDPYFIHTVRGVGYRFEPKAPASDMSSSRAPLDGSAYLIITSDGTIAWASTTVHHLLGRSASSLVGHSFKELTDATSFIERQARAGEVVDVQLHHAAGNSVGAKMIVRPIKSHTTVQSFLVEVLGDAVPERAPETVLPIMTSHHRPPVHLIYDERLVLTSMSPRDGIFLGWHAEDIVGTFFLLTTVPELLDDQARACALAQSIVDSGLRVVHDRMLARSAAGEAVSVHVHGEFLVDGSGRFIGLHASVTPD